MRNPVATTSFMFNVTREVAERHFAKFPPWANVFHFVCRADPYEVGALVAVKWDDGKHAVGQVKRKHSQVLVGIDFVGTDSERFEFAAWFPRSEVLPVVEVRAAR